jgi:type IV pilus assembly protein PilE
MITVVIAAILVSIAIPAYTSQIRKSRRTEARSAVLDLASREERFLSTNNTYSNNPMALGYSTVATDTWASIGAIGSGYYTINVTVTAADLTKTPPGLPGYSIIATTTGMQATDDQCASFSIDQTGKQTATGSGTNPTADCWG